MDWTLSLAREEDIPALDQLIPLSARSLLARYYSSSQIEAALGPVFGVDRCLIKDGTYFVARHCAEIVGCGGWSKRTAFFGGDTGARLDVDSQLDPSRDPARIRAFFIHPDWVRRGIGRGILVASEAAIIATSFRRVELSATLAGEPLYAAFGYQVDERYEIKMNGGLSLPVVRMSKRLIDPG